MNRKQVNDTVKKLMSFQENVKDGDLREILFNMQDNVSKVKLLSLIIWKFVIERVGGRSLEDDLLAKMHLLLDQNGPDRGLLFILEGWHLFRKEKKDEILELVRKESFWLVHGEGQYHVILQQYPKEKREILLHKYKNLSGIFNALGVKDGPESIIDVIEKLENAYQEIIKGGGSM